MALTRSIRYGSVTGMAAEAKITSWSMFAAAGRKKTFFRSRIFSTMPSPLSSSSTSTQSPTRGLIPARRNFPRARQVRSTPPTLT